jgi:class 3 adenylate cyclase/predicted ATPase
MDFYAMLDQVVSLLQQRGRVTYRALQRQFALDDKTLADLKEELLYAHPQVADDESRGLIWSGNESVPGTQLSPTNPQRPASNTPPPISYTPPHLAERIRAEQAALEARGSSDGERKTITALFADLKGSTALIEGLDPEEARAIIDPALQVMMDAVHRYEGYVAQALGDGIFALFGAPIAHEDHAQRALYAALRMQEEMRRYADRLREKGHPPLLMRIGVNTGEVVVRSIRKDDLHADYVPVGHSTNLAARMEQLAAPGSILVSAYTHRLTDGYFAFKDLGLTQIKGVEAPLNIYEVVGAGPLRTRLQVTATRRGLTRFVGRHSELDQMQRALDQAKAGHGQIVGVMGEPGLGKSRLLYEFKLTSQAGCLVLEAYSVSHGKASPYLPVIELLKTYFQLQPQDDERARREKVLGKVLGLERSLEDTLSYLFALLGIEASTASLQQMDPQIRRRRTFDALKKLFLRESLNQPLLLIFEDLHWIDSETQGWLDLLSESLASARVLLLVNYRPEYRHEWGSKTYYTQLRLAPFGKAEAEEFLTALLGDTAGTQHAVPLQPLRHLILEKTEGTPFFMEEVVQTLVEEATLAGERGNYRLTQHAPTLHIPPTVQGVLAARIDRLAAEEKALLQQLAIIGREFPLSLVTYVVSQPEEELSQLLAALQRKEFLYEQPAFPEVEYVFKHALTQEVAYNSVLQERRKGLHEHTARALEALYGQTLEDHYRELAHHYSRSGNTRKAVEYLQRAGQQDLQRSAYAGAISYHTTALKLLETLPDSPERVQNELVLQSTLAPAWMATKGYAAPEVETAYARALTLCRQVGETPQLFPILLGLWRFHLVRAEYQAARELGEQLLRLAESTQDQALRQEAHYALGATLAWMGAFSLARQHLEQGLLLYNPHQERARTLQDPGVACLSYTSWTLWSLGYPDQGRARLQEALTLSQQLSHPISQVFALNVTAMFYQLCREASPTQFQVEAATALATAQGFPYWVAQGTIVHGWALAEQGQWKEGIIQIHQGLDAYQVTGAENGVHWYLAMLAEAYGKAGQTEEGLSALAEAVATVDKCEERRFEAELYRLKGELTLQQENQKSKVKGQKSKIPSTQHPAPNTQAEAEGYFLKAIEIARKQQAKSLELRAVVSLVRLRQSQATQDASRITQHETRARFDEAHRMLSEVYNWFTEGFDTRDLQEAKVLLAQLS